jgi:sodium/potassium-transporting ATPase subunit alpha
MKLEFSALKIPEPKYWCFKLKKAVVDPLSAPTNVHKVALEDLVCMLETSVTAGLTELQAGQFLVKNGKNKIEHKDQNPVLKFIGYFFTGFCGLLWVAAIICILAWKPIGEPNSDPINLALAILLIIVVCLQAGFSAFQDWSSSKVMKSIRGLIPSSAHVIRGGAEHKIAAEDVVVGDVLLLAYGTKVAADVRIIESHDLQFDKSLLTGESEAVDGVVECTDERFHESKNIAFMTTLVTNGQGKGIVVATGKSTLIGKISGLTNVTARKETTLQLELRRFVFIVGFCAVVMALIVALVWIFWLRVKHPKYINLSTFLVNTISVMIAFIPEGKRFYLDSYFP